MSGEMEQPEQKSATYEVAQANEFADLLKQSFKPQGYGAENEISGAIDTLVKTALSDKDVVKSDVLETIEEHDRRARPRSCRSR